MAPKRTRSACCDTPSWKFGATRKAYDSPEALYGAVLKFKHSHNKHWDHVMPVMCEEDTNVALECTTCRARLGVGNPYAAFAKHFVEEAGSIVCKYERDRVAVSQAAMVQTMEGQQQSNTCTGTSGTTTPGTGTPGTGTKRVTARFTILLCFQYQLSALACL